MLKEKRLLFDFNNRYFKNWSFVVVFFKWNEYKKRKIKILILKFVDLIWIFIFSHIYLGAGGNKRLRCTYIFSM